VWLESAIPGIQPEPKRGPGHGKVDAARSLETCVFRPFRVVPRRVVGRCESKHLPMAPYPQAQRGRHAATQEAPRTTTSTTPGARVSIAVRVPPVPCQGLGSFLFFFLTTLVLLAPRRPHWRRAFIRPRRRRQHAAAVGTSRLERADSSARRATAANPPSACSIHRQRASEDGTAWPDLGQRVP
jgi:hypothetical protein